MTIPQQLELILAGLGGSGSSSSLAIVSSFPLSPVPDAIVVHAAHGLCRWDGAYWRGAPFVVSLPPWTSAASGTAALSYLASVPLPHVVVAWMTTSYGVSGNPAQALILQPSGLPSLAADAAVGASIVDEVHADGRVWAGGYLYAGAAALANGGYRAIAVSVVLIPLYSPAP